MRAGGLVLSGACFAAFAGFTIAASPSQVLPGSATNLAHGASVGGASSSGVVAATVPVGGTAAPAAGPRASSYRVLSVVNQPTLDSLTPSSGSTAGGNDVVITASGGGLTGSTQVDFGSNPVAACGSGTCFSVDTDTQITVHSVPGGAAGNVSVDVVTLTGTTAPLTYTYVAPVPTLTSLSPTSGSTAGGNDVILTGTNFTGATSVDFGTSSPPLCGTGFCFSIDSDTQITIHSVPAHAAGGVSVDVVTPGGTTGTQTYTYAAPTPTLTSLSPTSGSTLGGNDVILTGTNFTGATSVDFGTSSPPLCGTGFCFSIDSDTQITVHVVPAHAAGGVSVDVVTPGGTTAALTYTYVTPPPTLTSLAPTSGSTLGGNSLVLTGINFTGATVVNVGTSPLAPCGTAPCFTINSDTQITVTMPASTPGTVNVDVVTPGGTTGSLPYTYVAPGPTVTAVSPNAGAPAGGNTVTLTGTDFEAAGTPITSQVTVVGSPAITSTPCVTTPTAPCFTVTSATSITIEVLPPGTGMTHITVTTPGGTSPIASGNVYTYVSVFPNVTSVSPRSGAEAGKTVVIITGTNFGTQGSGFAPTDVMFGTTHVTTTPCPINPTAPCFNAVSATKISVFTPATTTPGPVDVRVTTPASPTPSNLVPGDVYTYVGPGAYTALTPFRICDTRVGSPTIACRGRTLGAPITVQITGGPVPSNAQAVVVNLTAINHSSSGTFVSAYPAGGVRPLVSNINVDGGAVQANLAIVALSPGGAITIFNSVGSVDVIVDVQGYFAAPGGSAAGEFHSLAPVRICDTRANTRTVCATTANNPLAGGTWRKVVVSGLPPGGIGVGIPPDGTAATAVFNLTAVGGTRATFLAVAPPNGSDQCPTRVSASNLNPKAGEALPNRVVSPLGPNRDICVFNSVGSINFIVDVNGWFGTAAAPAGAFFYAVPPTRICDTRANTHTACAGTTNNPLSGASVRLIQVAGVTVVPAVGGSTKPVAVVANLTGVAGTASTFLELYPSDAAHRPGSSDLNPSLHDVIANLAVVGLSTTTGLSPGDVSLYNSVGSINAILDVAGWFQ